MVKLIIGTVILIVGIIVVGYIFLFVAAAAIDGVKRQD